MSWRFAAGVVGSLAVAGGAFYGGLKYGVQTTRAEQAELRLKDSEDTLRQVRTLVENGDRLAQAYESRAVEIRTHTTTILREIPRAITPEVDAAYPVPWSVVRMHDKATRAVLSPAAYGPDDAASDVAASDLVGTVALNYGACTEDRARLTALQDWARAVTTETDR